jgi:uncharacterized caspase-like protein
MRILRWSWLALMISVLRPVYVSQPPAFTLEIPELQTVVQGDSSHSLARMDFNTFRIVIHTSQITYGSIRSKINTESAGTIMDTKTVGDTIVCTFDLTQRSGFQFRPGRNSVEIEATDYRRNVFYASFLLDVGRLAPSGVLKTAGVPEDLHGVKKYAVVIGISKYKDPAIPALQFADRDAEAMRDFLLSPEGGRFEKDKIRYLLNEEATLKNIRTALYTFLTFANSNDMVVIYFAGHGSPDPNDRRNLYLLPYDTEIYNMGGTAFPMWEVQDVFSRIIKARRIVTFTDACHSAGISGQSAARTSPGRSGTGQNRDLRLEPAQDAPGNNLFNQYMARYAGDEHRAVLTASDISERSMESEMWGGGHGVFTHYLLEGLKGKADRNGDGTVTAGELFDYVHDQVLIATHQQQNPTALPGLARDLPLSGKAVRLLADR